MTDPNIQRADKDWPAVVIASAFTTGVQIARDLTRRGVRVFLIDSNPAMDGFRSVHGKTILCPSADRDPQAWFRFLTNFSQRFDAQPVLMAASDEYVSAIGRFADELSQHYRISSSAQLQAQLAVKEGQVQLAQEHGLPIPHTKFAITEQDVRDFARDAQFPVIFKPRQHRYWANAPLGHPMHLVKAVESNSTAQLLENYRLASEFDSEVVLQEKILGPDTNKRVHVGIYRSDGLRLGQLTLKELRSIRLSVPTVNEPVQDPHIAQIADRFYRAMQYSGTCEIEFMRDDRDGTPKMIDINPRFTGAGTALPHAGIDQAWLLYLDLIGKPVQPVTPSLLSFRHIMFEGDMLSIRQYWEDGRLEWNALRESYRLPIYFGDIDLRDWRRSWPAIWRITRTTAGTLKLMVLGASQVNKKKKMASTQVGSKTQPR